MIHLDGLLCLLALYLLLFSPIFERAIWKPIRSRMYRRIHNQVCAQVEREIKQEYGDLVQVDPQWREDKWEQFKRIHKDC